MLRVDRLLNAINSKVVNWTFSNVHETVDKARKEAAELYILDKVCGAKVRNIGNNKFVTFYWVREV